MREEKGRDRAIFRFRKEEKDLAGNFGFASEKVPQPGSDTTLITNTSSMP